MFLSCFFLPSRLGASPDGPLHPPITRYRQGSVCYIERSAARITFKGEFFPLCWLDLPWDPSKGLGRLGCALSVRR